MTSPYGDRELDVAIATKVFGWKWRLYREWRILVDPYHESERLLPACQEDIQLSNAWNRGLPFYKTDPAAYMAVLSEMTRRGFQWFIHAGFESPIAAGFARPGPIGKTFDSVGESIGEAVCRAALAAVAAGGGA